ncbi:hypothetical protein ACNSOL_01425 [Aliarcobacter lanthieri]|uniref:hypothetical protein n=1 Tax=Aliarcobacter lanthieri TaxID=1355374 RepID=UPI003AADB50B
MELATITATAALLTGIANLFMILEMRKQRRANTKSVLKILQSNYKVTIDSNNNWNWKNNENKDNNAFVEIINFGLGSAYNITCSWSCDYNLLINSLKSLDKNNKFNFTYNNNFLEIDNSFHILRNQSTIQIDALTTKDISNKSNILNIPPYYIRAQEKLIQLVFFDNLNNLKEIEYDLDDFPDLDLEIRYEDINNIRFIEKFKVRISFSSISKNDINLILKTNKISTSRLKIIISKLKLIFSCS